jgi:pimeloyl-ACP methyl ester carboxylesterase
MGLAFLAVAVVGFSTTFFFPLARGTFAAPPIIFIHGGLLFSWLFFFILQASLIRSRSVALHRRMG